MMRKKAKFLFLNIGKLKPDDIGLAYRGYWQEGINPVKIINCVSFE